MSKLIKGKKRSSEPFVGIAKFLFHTEAWLSLSTAARAVFVQLAVRYNGSNNGRLALSARDAAKECRISKNTATKAFKELVAKGFIEVEVLGSYKQHTRHASEYLVTAWRDDIRKVAPKKTYQHWKKCPVPIGSSSVV